MTLDLALAFGIPMAVGAAVLATPVLHLCSTTTTSRPTSPSGSSRSRRSSSQSPRSSISYSSARTGSTSTSRRRFSDYLKSSILFVGKVNIALGIVYVASVYSIVKAGIYLGLTTASIIELWAAAQLCCYVFFIAIKARKSKRPGEAHHPSLHVLLCRGIGSHGGHPLRSQGLHSIRRGRSSSPSSSCSWRSQAWSPTALSSSPSTSRSGSSPASR